MTLAVVSVVIVALYFAREVFIPLALAVLLSFLLAPMVIRLRHWGLGRISAVLSVALLSFSMILGIAGLVTLQVIDLANELPRYQRNIEAKIRSIHDAAPSGGLIDKASKMAKELSEELASPAEDSPTPSAQDSYRLHVPKKAVEPLPVEVREPKPTPLQVAGDVLGPLAGPLATAGLVLVFVIFILIQREDLRNRLLRLIGAEKLHATTKALDDAARRVSRYLMMQLIVNACYGIPIGLGLYFIGVPNPVLWGLLATLLRFIPYVGPAIAMTMPMGLAFAVDPGWTMMLSTIALFVVLELFSNNVMEPWLYGSTTGISPVAILLAAVFWTWLWGPVGLLLAIPLTVCLVVIGQHVPQLEFLSVMLGDEPVLEPGARFYQRMLAMDQEEATELAEQFLEAQPLEALYDTVIIPALCLAEQDRHQGTLDEVRRRYLVECTRDLIEDLIDHGEAGILEVAGEEGRPYGDVTPAPSSDSPSAFPAVLCIPARDDADELAAIMLTQLLERRGIGAVALSLKDASAEGLDEVGRRNVGIVCISAVPPAALMRARYLCKRLRSRFPDLTIVVGLWNIEADQTGLRNRLSALMANNLATSLAQAVEQIIPLIETEITSPMASAPIPAEEEKRLAALYGLELLDTEPEEVFDRVTRELATAFDVPIALMSLVDADRQFWKSQVGLPPDLAAARASPRDTSLCGHVVTANDVLVVEDTLKDKRFANNPFLRATGIRFYAGAPLRTRGGHAVGSLCILDTKPRRIRSREKALLRMIADAMMTKVELRQALQRIDLITQPFSAHERVTQRDFVRANAVTQLLLPPAQQRPDAYLACHIYQPVAKHGGDFLDIHRRDDGATVLLLANLRAEGEPAERASLMMSAALVRAMASTGKPHDLLSAIGRDLRQAARSGKGITALVAVFEPDTRRLAVASAGHPHPILLRGDAARTLELDGDPPLLIAPEHEYKKSFMFELTAGDRMLLYTEGAVRAVDPASIELGSERLASLMRDARRLEGSAFLREIFAGITNSTGHGLQDDVAIISLECVGTVVTPQAPSWSPQCTPEIERFEPSKIPA